MKNLHRFGLRSLVLVWWCLASAAVAHAQAPPAALPVKPLLTKADTVAALQQLFAEKRKSKGVFLVGVPVGIGVALVGTGLTAASALDGTGSTPVGPLLVFGAGVTGTVLSIRRILRYSNNAERYILDRYERKRRLSGWIGRQMRQQRANSAQR
jgi:hypothetical protein